MGSGKDIGKDKPAFGWELEPFVTFGSISGNVSWGNYRKRKQCEKQAMTMAMRSGILIHRALGMGVLRGPRGRRSLMDEVPFFSQGYRGTSLTRKRPLF